MKRNDSAHTEGAVSGTVPHRHRKTSGRTFERALELKTQAAAARRAAVLIDDERTQSNVLAAASTLDALAEHDLRRLEGGQAPVLVLPDNASAVELRNARQRRAVKRRDALYLPAWRSGAVGLPNIMLRSALFSSALTAGCRVESHDLPVQGDASLLLSGLTLIGYDRRVLAACMSCLEEDQPIWIGERASWVRVSVSRLAHALNVTYGLNVHRAILDSLCRLDQARLRVRIRGEDLPGLRLLELDDDALRIVHGEGDARPRGSDLITFSIPAEFAELFGPTSWSTLSDAVLHDYSGLVAWLASYYSTHAGPYPLKITALLSWSGSVCDLREFRRRLKRALLRLQQGDVPEEHRVLAFELTDVSVTVHLCRWQTDQQVSEGFVGAMTKS